MNFPGATDTATSISATSAGVLALIVILLILTGGSKRK